MNDAEPAPVVTVADRLIAAGITLDRIADHLRAGRVTVDGEVVTNGQHPAPPPARVVLRTT